MAPEYDKLVDLIKEKRQDVVIARLEGSINEEISMIYEMFSFPRVVLFHPEAVEIKSEFRGKRISQVLFNWIEQMAPTIKIEKQNLKMLQDNKPEANAAIALEEQILKIVNKTKAYDLEEAVVGSGKNMTGEIEFLKIEMLNMKNRIINFEKDIEELKNNTRNLYNNNKSDKVNLAENNSGFNSSGLNHEDLALKLKLVKEKKRISEGFFDNISTLKVFIFVVILLFFIAAVIIIKKILFKKVKNIVSNDHAKI